MSKACVRCGALVRVDAKFCPSCGVSFEDTEHPPMSDVPAGVISMIPSDEPPSLDWNAAPSVVDDDQVSLSPGGDISQLPGRTPAPADENQSLDQETETLDVETLIGVDGRYRILQQLGAGGFGQAYLAEDVQINRLCVIKRFFPHRKFWKNCNEETRNRIRENFAYEARLLVTLNSPGHPNIPEIYEYLEESDCLVMKYITGKSLRQILTERGGILPETEALRYIRDVCSALVYMHSREPNTVSHRDLKPDNILVDSSDRVWVIDFGLSKALPVVHSTTAATRSSAGGTPGYAPPEQRRGRAEPRSDIYALAVTLHELLTGHKPWQHPTLPSVRTLNPEISPTVETLIQQGIAGDVKDRPVAKTFLQTIESIISPSAPLTVTALQLPSFDAPDGTKINDPQKLVSWCEQHWDEAVVWLYHDLPQQIEQTWGETRLASEIALLLQEQKSDRHMALDQVLAMIDPEGFGAEIPHLKAETMLVKLNRDTFSHPLTLKNSGRRYLRARCQLPSWVFSKQPIVELRPGHQETMTLRLDHDEVRRVMSYNLLRYFKGLNGHVVARSGSETLISIGVVRPFHLLPGRKTMIILVLCVVLPIFVLCVVLPILFGGHASSDNQEITTPSSRSNPSEYVPKPTEPPTPTPQLSFSSETGGFSIAFPESKTGIQEDIEVDHGIFLLDTSDARYVVSYWDYEETAISSANVEQILDDEIDGLMLEFKGTLVETQHIDLDDYPGRAITAKGKVFDTDVVLTVRVYLVDNRGYMILVAVPVDRVSTVDTEQFLDSFTLY